MSAPNANGPQEPGRDPRADAPPGAPAANKRPSRPPRRRAPLRLSAEGGADPVPALLVRSTRAVPKGRKLMPTGDLELGAVHNWQAFRRAILKRSGALLHAAREAIGRPQAEVAAIAKASGQAKLSEAMIHRRESYGFMSDAELDALMPEDVGLLGTLFLCRLYGLPEPDFLNAVLSIGTDADRISADSLRATYLLLDETGRGQLRDFAQFLLSQRALLHPADLTGSTMLDAADPTARTIRTIHQMLHNPGGSGPVDPSA